MTIRAQHAKWKVEHRVVFTKVDPLPERSESFFRQEILASYTRLVATLFNQVFNNTKVEEKTTGPSAMARLGNPVAHLSGWCRCGSGW